MIIRLLLAAFISVLSGVCYLSGLRRLMSALLIGFGVLAALFFGMVFSFPAGSERISFSVNASGAAWPFFLLAVILIGLIVVLFFFKQKPIETEQFGSRHLKFLGGGLLLYLFSLFFPVFLWFPSDEMHLINEGQTAEIMVLLGVVLYLVGSCAALYLLYRSTKGATQQHPDLMKRFVPALFSVFHLDKIPSLVAYLLIYSSEPPFVFPKIAALALTAYIPVSLFLMAICSPDTNDQDNDVI